MIPDAADVKEVNTQAEHTGADDNHDNDEV
jgi:hypothetical protein